MSSLQRRLRNLQQRVRREGQCIHRAVLSLGDSQNGILVDGLSLGGFDEVGVVQQWFSILVFEVREIRIADGNLPVIAGRFVAGMKTDEMEQEPALWVGFADCSPY